MDVEIEDLRFSRGDRLVLAIPSLRLRSEHVTAVLGPNGAGKTTLLRLIAGLENPDAGRIVAGGAPLSRSRASAYDIAYVFQENVFLRQSVRGNLELGLALRGVSRSERQERVAEAAGLLDITHLLDRRADRLSGGEGRRVSLARALCLRARLALLDEPLAGLDPETYARLLDQLPGVLDAFGTTTVLVTHHREEALRLASDLVVLVDGRVHSAGAKSDVVLNPGSATAAEILGYTVLERGGRRIAIPAGALRPGPGPIDFELVVERVLDLVSHAEIVGRIGTVRVHVASGERSAIARPGERIAVHAERVCEIVT